MALSPKYRIRLEFTAIVCIAFVVGFVLVRVGLTRAYNDYHPQEAVGWKMLSVVHAGYHVIWVPLIGGLAAAGIALCVWDWLQSRLGLRRCRACGRPLKGARSSCECQDTKPIKITGANHGQR